MEVSRFDEIEDAREFNEALEFEEYVEAARARNAKPCPACGMPMEDPELIVCEGCLEEYGE